MVINDRAEKHEFALHIPGLSQQIQHTEKNGVITFQNKDLFHRIAHVLRLKLSDICILFDQSVNISFQIQAFEGKKKVVGKIVQKNKNEILAPHITFLLPILKRDDLDTAVYLLAEMGVNSIQLITTEKAQRSWRAREFDRLQRVVIAAAEQSKHFAFPILQEPKDISELLLEISETKSEKIFFDPSGISSFELCTSLRQDKQEHLFLLVGPEGDLTSHEKEELQKHNFIFAALTPTILKASHAAGISAGMFRSFLL